MFVGALLFLVAVVFLSPVLALFAQLSGATLAELFASPTLGKAISVTLSTGLSGALIAVLGGLFFARKFALYDWRGKRLQRLLLLVPYLIPNFILATAYVIGWNPVTGLLNGLVRFPGGLYGQPGMGVLFGVVHLPVAFLLLEQRFQRIDSSLREAARLSGAGSWHILRAIELPLVLPSLVGSYVLCFALNISAFAIPAWVGSPEHAYTLTYRIYQAIQVDGSEGIPRAAAFSLILFVLVIPFLALGSWVQRDAGKYVLVTGKAARIGERTATLPSTVAFQLFFWIWQGLFWMLPLLTLTLTTLVKPGCLQQSGLACFKESSLHTYSYVLFELQETKLGFQGSLVYGTLAAVAIILFSFACLLLFGRTRWRARIADWIFAVPVSTPGAIIALGLIVVASGRFGINLYNTPWIVVLAYVLKHLNLAYQPLKNGLHNISSSLFEAARLSGARNHEVWRSIGIPMLAPELAGGFFLVLIPILGELTMSVFLVSPGFRAIGTVLFDLQDYADQSSACALSVLLVLLILVLNEASRALSRGRLGY